MTDRVQQCVVCPPTKPQKAQDGGYLVCFSCSNRILRWLRELEEYLPTLSVLKTVKGGERGAPGFSSQSPADDIVLFHTDARSGPEFITEEVKQQRLDKHGKVVLDGHGREVMDPVFDEDGNPIVRVKEGSSPTLPAKSAVNSWACLVAEERAIEQPSAFWASVRILRSNHQWLTCQPFVDEYASELREVHRAVRAAANDPVPQSAGKCINMLRTQVCGGTVYELPDFTGVKCSNCNRIYTGLDLDRLRVAQEEAS